jgi:hopanoid biosynthesis associated protein HpnK
MERREAVGSVSRRQADTGPAEAGTANRRLIVNADDFGRSSEINSAVIRAHREGILTSTSLMVTGEACAEAVRIAQQNPSLGVGLHLTLVCGRAALPLSMVSGLADADGNFSSHAPAAGCRFFFKRALRLKIEAEVGAQFERFHATGLPLDHVNGHLNFHLHPTVFSILMANAERWGVRHLRLTRDPFWFNARLAGGAWGYRASHAFIYWLLSAWARGKLRHRGIRFAPHVYGLLQNARVDEAFVARLLSKLPPGDSELYSHPSLSEFRHELEALISPRVKRLVAEQGIQLIRYQDLA